jgi:hypothetical protein
MSTFHNHPPAQCTLSEMEPHSGIYSSDTILNGRDLSVWRTILGEEDPIGRCCNLTNYRGRVLRLGRAHGCLFWSSWSFPLSVCVASFKVSSHGMAT